jgi:hypothetical protein
MDSIKPTEVRMTEQELTGFIKQEMSVRIKADRVFDRAKIIKQASIHPNGVLWYIDNEISSITKCAESNFFGYFWLASDLPVQITVDVFKWLDKISKIVNTNSLNSTELHKKGILKFLDLIFDIYLLQNIKSEFIESEPVKQATKIEFKTLKDAVKNTDAYDKIIATLISNNLIDKDSHVCIDKEKGSVGSFYSTMVLFCEGNYFKRKPTIAEYRNICMETFKVDVSDSTARNKATRKASRVDVRPFHQNT